jgi:DMATS type aromatic prenyltransferase
MWWKECASRINEYLRNTEYTVGSQYRHLLLFYAHFLPQLGSFPDEKWGNLRSRSFVNPFGPPMEFGINYQNDSRCKFRMYFDPMESSTDGTEKTDDLAVRMILDRLKPIQSDIDMTWFDHFDSEVAVSIQEAHQHWGGIPPRFLAYDSQRCIGLDLLEESVLAKVYFSPLMKSIVMRSDPAHVMFDAISKQDNARNIAAALAKVKAYISSVRSQLLDPEIFCGFDCNDPEKSRLKIYIGWSGMSLHDVRECWTLGGRVKGQEIERGLDLVERMWRSIYPSRLADDAKQPLTMVWNWELTPHNPNPAPKAYFGFTEQSDVFASGVLTELFAHLGWHGHIASHQSMMKTLR